MLIHRAACALSLALILSSYPAMAQTPAAAPTPAAAGIKLPDLPSGMCPVDPSQDADRNVLPDLHLAVQGKYKLLAVFGECVNLKELRSGTSRVTTLNYYGTVIQQQGGTPIDRTSNIESIANAIGLAGAYAPEAVKEQQYVGLGVRRASYQGIIKKTADYIIVGTEQRHLVATKQFSIAAVSLITVVNGNIITVNLYRPADSDQIYSLLAQTAEGYAQQLLALNP